jgi:transcriptional regulator with XRE-family HTH domain
LGRPARLPKPWTPGHTAMTEPSTKKKKFKYTRELIRIANEDGMSQKEIADLCRVNQSVVSGWLNGKSLAFEHQITELKKRYGNRLNRTTSRVYLTLNEASPSPRWEETARAQRLLAIRQERERIQQACAKAAAEASEKRSAATESCEGEDLPDDATPDENFDLKALEPELREIGKAIHPQGSLSLYLDELLQADQEEFENSQTIHREHLVQVEGPIVLRYTFFKNEIRRGRTDLEIGRTPWARWLVHHQPSGRFVLVSQGRRLLMGRTLWMWQQILEASGRRLFGGRYHNNAHYLVEHAAQEPYIECADDSARWLSAIHGPMEATALIEHCDRYFLDPGTIHGPHDERTLPFLLRKMLVEHGHDVSGLVRILDSE